MIYWFLLCSKRVLIFECIRFLAPESTQGFIYALKFKLNFFKLNLNEQVNKITNLIYNRVTDLLTQMNGVFGLGLGTIWIFGFSWFGFQKKTYFQKFGSYSQIFPNFFWISFLTFLTLWQKSDHKRLFVIWPILATMVINMKRRRLDLSNSF